MVMVVFTLGVGIIAVSASNYMIDQAEHDYQAAFYAAESGLRHQMEFMKAEIDRLYLEGSYTNPAAFFNTVWGRIKGTKTLEFDVLDGKPVTAVVTTNKGTMGNDFCEYKIQSIGSVGNIKRTLASTVRVNYAHETAVATVPLYTLFSYAVFADDQVQLKGSPQIYGNAGINATFSKAFYLEGSPAVYGDVVIGPNGDIDQVIHIPWGSMDNFIKGETRANSSVVKFPNIEPMGKVNFPDVRSKPSLVADGVDVINQNGGGQFSKIVVTASGRLTLNLGNGDRVYTDEIKVDGAGKASVHMSGDAEIYARKLTLGGSGKLSFHVEGNKSIYVETLDLSGASAGDIISIEGAGRLLLFVEKDLDRGGSANINLNGDPSKLIVFFNGSSIDFSGGGGDPCFTGGLYAPHATVNLSGSATVKGSVVASNINMSGSASVRFGKVIDEDDPLFGGQKKVGPESFVIVSYEEY